MTTITTKYPFVGCVDTRQGGRIENQDNAGFVDTPLGLLLVVCDGMGGGPGGRTASLMAVDTILNVLSEVSEHTPREDALKFAIEKANDIIYSKAKDTPELRGMGTTVAAILINENSAVIAHAGDTRIYQLRKGTIVFRSSDHSVVANLVRQNRITEEEARNHPQSNIVTRALGIRPSMEIEFDEVAFLRGDRFVLCTDGIWGMMPQRDLVKSLSRVMGISELTSSLAEEIDGIGQSNGGGHDNLTLAILDSSFDSAQKKVKVKHSENDSTASKRKRATIEYILIALVVITAIFLLIFLSQIRQCKDNAPVINSQPLKGKTLTTIVKRPIRTEEDSVSQDSVCIENNNAILASKGHMGNPFQDSTIIRKEQVTRQIELIVRKLDTLTIIKGKNSVRKRREYINGAITPNIEFLENKVVDEKKKDVKYILLLLNDRKVVSSDYRGYISKEGKEHINVIKTKIRDLRN